MANENYNIGWNLVQHPLIANRGSNSIIKSVKNFIFSLDYLQIFSLAILLFTGLLFVYTTGQQINGENFKTFFNQQLCWIFVGTIGYFFMASVNYRHPAWRLGVIIFYLTIIFLLFLVPFIGVKVFGATRWLKLGPLRIQPSEPAKLALILLLGVMSSSRLFNINKTSSILICLIVTALPFSLIAAEPDLGSAVILMPIMISMIFCIGLKWRTILGALICVVIIASLAVTNELFFHPMLKPYQKARVMVFLNPQSDRTGYGYNVYQSCLAIGTGGWHGKGVGEGTQNRLGFLPPTVSNNDFIFSVIAEETGFLGCATLLTTYSMLLLSILRTALRAKDDFGRAIATGSAVLFFMHIFINIGMSIGIVPVTGLPLPFVSYGGSFILTGMLDLGILQSVYRYSNAESQNQISYSQIRA